MARKSRKHLPEAESAALPKVYVAAGYLRLSADDRRKKGDSIANQRSIIQSFLAGRPDIQLHDFYTDNAKSGTGFDRPAFIRMMEDAENGVINCIIVKDLSRFGRNAIDAGFYLERKLPALGIRFLSLSDQFDSNEGDGGLMLPLRNVINEAYALDIGKKCRAVQQHKIAEGKFVGRLAPYGYRKAPHDHHKLEIDGVTAPVVRRIFEMASAGTGPQEICRTLNGAKHPPPSRDRRERGLLRENDDTPFAQYWSRSIVSRILADKVYVGDMVQGKSKKQGNRRVQTPEKEWVCVQNTHEAIISRGQFEKVQAVLRQASAEALQNRRPKIPFVPSLFKGKVFCGHCSFALKICRQNKDNVYWYRCQTQNRIYQNACYPVSVKETDLRAGAALMLRRYAETLLGQKLKLCKKAIHAAPSAEESAKETQRIQRETDMARAQFKALFEALLAERISPGEFAAQKQEHEARMAALSGRVLELQTSPRQIQRQVRECWELASCMEAASCEYDLTAELLDSLIERILVYHDKSFEIVWRFSAPFENTEGIPWAM